MLYPSLTDDDGDVVQVPYVGLIAVGHADWSRGRPYPQLTFSAVLAETSLLMKERTDPESSSAEKVRTLIRT